MSKQVTPPVSTSRKEVFQFRLSLTEREKLNKLAHAKHLPVAAYVRAAALGELR